MTEQDKEIQELRRVVGRLKEDNELLRSIIEVNECISKKLDRCRAAISIYGWRKQAVVAIEEMSELQKEICKALRNDELMNREALIEEIADVKIMLWQLQQMFQIADSEIEVMMIMKLDRLSERLRNEEPGL